MPAALALADSPDVDAETEACESGALYGVCFARKTSLVKRVREVMDSLWMYFARERFFPLPASAEAEAPLAAGVAEAESGFAALLGEAAIGAGMRGGYGIGGAPGYPYGCGYMAG